jgi:KDO2-lipid IV(A) lauroyltransferase
MNDGIEVPFFGRPAMTAPAAVDLARKFDVPVYPIRIERLNGARFRVTMFPKMELPETGDRHADIAEGMRRVNVILEQWIRERPGQWFWLHRRWPES